MEELSNDKIKDTPVLYMNDVPNFIGVLHRVEIIRKSFFYGYNNDSNTNLIILFA